MPLRRKVLLLIASLTLCIILSLSGIYYRLLTGQIEKHSRDQITLAFKLVFDDVRTRVQGLLAKIDSFNTSIASPMYLSQLLQEQYNEQDLSVRNVRKLMVPLSSVLNETRKFGAVIDALDVFIFTPSNTLLAMYQQDEEELIAGLYLPQISSDSLITVTPDDDWYATLRELQDIPLRDIPMNIPLSYNREIPKNTQATIEKRGRFLTIQFIIPMIQRNELSGICQINVALQQKDVERYARLSTAQVSIFAEKNLSVSTLPSAPPFPEASLASSKTVDLVTSLEENDIEFSDVTIQNQEYYQGILMLHNGKELLGAVTAHFPRSVEEQNKREFLLIVAGIVLVFALLTAAGASFLSAVIVKPLAKLTRLIQQLSTGDLTGIEELPETTAETMLPVSEEGQDKITQQGSLSSKRTTHAKDEIALLEDALRKMSVKLREIVADVQQAANRVHTGSHDLMMNAEQTSQWTTKQASATGQASASMEQMVSNIRQNTDNAKQTETIAIKVARDARESGHAVEETVLAMQEITKKISIVQDIARQTRMLSLNATIEAARAQEYGSGFSVVAGEVRSLAERSQNAAAEIDLLANSNVAIAEKAGHMLFKLVPDIQKTSELVQEISSASVEQNTGANQINTAIQQLDQVTQQSASLSEKMAITAEELAKQAEQLHAIIKFFKIDRPEKEQGPI